MTDLIGMSKSHPYEEPSTPDLIINTDQESEDTSARLLLQKTLHWLETESTHKYND